jgi:hypothetical protein
MMLSSRILQAALFSMSAACTPIAMGCVVAVRPAPVVVDEYEPVYYDGYVVYYDDAGRPYYYLDGGISYVPRTYVHYSVLVRHYDVHKVRYRTWQDRDGRRYRTYRRVEPRSTRRR